MKKAAMVLVAVFGLAGLVGVAFAHTPDGYGGQGYGWMMGPGWGWMHSGAGPGWMHGSGDYCGGPGWGTTASATLLPADQIQKRVEAFAGKSFPGSTVGQVERDDYGRPFYTASLTGKNGRFEVQVNGFTGEVVGIYPAQE